MTASTEVIVGDPDGQHVLIRALSRNHPGLFNPDDANWIACEVAITAGAFRAEFHADLRAEDLQMFLDEAEGLTRTLDGTASFSTDEEQLAFTLTGDGREAIRVQGEAADLPGSDNRLRFSFDIDQACLPQICASLALVLEAFPVVRGADA